MTDYPAYHLPSLRILVTRPRHQAAGLIKQLQQAQALPVLFPVMTIKPLTHTPTLQQALQHYEQADFLIFTSTNAVDCMLPILKNAGKNWPPLSPVLAIGSATKNHLAKNGCRQIITPDQQFSTEGLLQKINTFNMANKTVIIFGGAHPRLLLESSLTQLGATVIHAACYQREALAIDLDINQQLTLLQSIDIILCNSVQTVDYLVAIFTGKARNILFNKHFISASARIAQHLIKLGTTNLPIIADNPDDNSIMSALTLWYKEYHHD